MFKNQLQELAQRSCFNLPSYTCIREGPDHAPRFKATVNFNGETFESPSYCFTLRQAEHSAAEVALNELASRGPTNSLAAKILDETGVYKNLLQEVSQRVGASLPVYTTFRSGSGHVPIFTGTVELAGVIFTGDPAKTKKQAEKNVAMSAWFSLKSLLQQFDVSREKPHRDELEHVTVARALQKYLIKARLAKVSFPIKFPTTSPRPLGRQPSPPTTSKILPLICPETSNRNRPVMSGSNRPAFQKYVRISPNPPVTVSNEICSSVVDIISKLRHQKFPAAEAEPYIPVRHCNPHARIAPPVTIRNAIPVFSAPPVPAPQPSLAARPPALSLAPPVCVRQAAPVYGARVRIDELARLVHPALMLEDPRLSRPATAKVEPSVGRAVAVRPEESPVSKFPVLQVQEPLGCKLFPISVAKPSSELPKVQISPAPVEVPRVLVESPVSIISSSLANSKASVKEARIVVLEKLKESPEVEELKNLKI